MARGKHLFPFRTEPLSPSAPMVLGPQGPGRVGRRRFLLRPRLSLTGGGDAFNAWFSAARRVTRTVRVPSRFGGVVPRSLCARPGVKTAAIESQVCVVGGSRV